MSTCPKGHHKYEHVLGVAHYPEIETVYWCPRCGTLKRVISRMEPSGEAGRMVREVECPPKGVADE